MEKRVVKPGCLKSSANTRSGQCFPGWTGGLFVCWRSGYFDAWRYELLQEQFREYSPKERVWVPFTSGQCQRFGFRAVALETSSYGRINRFFTLKKNVLQISTLISWYYACVCLHMHVTISTSDSRAHTHDVTKVIYLINDTFKIDWGHHFDHVQWRKGVIFKTPYPHH